MPPKKSKARKPLDNMKCLCCGCSIEHMAGDVADEAMWKQGIVGKIEANYGSTLDGNIYLIAICDSCTNNKVKEKTMKLVGVKWGIRI